MRFTTFAIALGLALATAGCQKGGDQSAVSQATEIAWREGDVDDALAEGRRAASRSSSTGVRNGVRRATR